MNEFNPKITLGVVVRADVETLKKMQDFFNSIKDLQVVYIKTSGNDLYITEQKPK